MAVELLPLLPIGIIIILAIVLSIIVKKLGQNPVLGYIIAGFVLGPVALGFLHPTEPLIQGFGEMGLFILLFYLGLELSLKDFLAAGQAALGLGLVDMVLSAGFGFLLMYLLGYSFLFAVIVGMMLFCTSTAVVAKFAIDSGKLHDPSTQLAISVLILQDFLGILLLVFATSMSAEGGSAIGLAMTALVFAVAAFFAVHYLSRLVDKWLSENGFGHTEMTLYALGVGLIVAMLGSFLGLSTALGAYFAGFALAETKSGSKIKLDVEFLRDFFLVFFFVAFGTSIFFDHLTETIIIPPIETLLFFLGISVVLGIGALIAHSLSTSIVGPVFGLARKDSSNTAILLLPLGEFVVILATAAAVVLPSGENTVIATIAFMLIAVTIIMFQPIYNNISLHQRIVQRLPMPFKLKQPTKTKIVEHTTHSIELLKKIALNSFVVLCFATLTVMFYQELPVFGVPIPYGRQATAVAVFLFFAIVPAIRALTALKELVFGAS
ncbi:MAG: cation:proton antiporter [Candidatus Diapherotrites archaeon]|uniref:Cation:proton antiporter n=1 Tax=Candidatus Iainarchaeum sp. TaxID=3101447 RepID=A0A938YPL0_9ARCH|nr:cation:proton antiporter [Candidatus Diapherotrites archaeon]